MAKEAHVASRISMDLAQQLIGLSSTFGIPIELKDSGNLPLNEPFLKALADAADEKKILEGGGEYEKLVQTINEYEKTINSNLIDLIKALNSAEERARIDFEKKLSSKDLLIEDLQRQKKEYEKEKDDALNDAANSEKAKDAAEKDLSEMKNKLQKAEETAQDKERYIQTLLEKLSDAEEKLDGYDNLKKSEDTLKMELLEYKHKTDLIDADLRRARELNQEYQDVISSRDNDLKVIQSEKDALRDECTSLRKDLEAARQRYEQSLDEQKRSAEQAQELAVERAVTQAKADLQTQIQELRDEKTRLEIQLNLVRQEQGDD